MAVTDLPRLAAIFGVSPAYFFGDDDAEDVSRSDVMRFYNGLPPVLQTATRQQLKALFDAQAAEARELEPTTHGKKSE